MVPWKEVRLMSAKIGIPSEAIMRSTVIICSSPKEILALIHSRTMPFWNLVDDLFRISATCRNERVLTMKPGSEPSGLAFVVDASCLGSLRRYDNQESGSKKSVA